MEDEGNVDVVNIDTEESNTSKRVYDGALSSATRLSKKNQVVVKALTKDETDLISGIEMMSTYQ